MEKKKLLILLILTLIIPVIGGGGVFFPPTINYLPPVLIFFALFYFALLGELFTSFLHLPLVALAIFSLASVIWAVDKDLALSETFRIIACLSIFPLSLSLSRDRIKWVIYALAISSGFIAFYGIIEYLRTWLITGDPTWRIFSTFVNPNILAGFLAMTIFPTLALFISAGKGDLILGFLLFAQIIALILTGSRGGFLAFAGAFLFFLIVVYRMKMLLPFIKKAVPLLLIVCILAYLGGFIRPLGRRVAGGGTMEEAQSATFRALLWRSAEMMIRAKPFGWGAGSFELVYPKYAIGGFSRTAHNSYLQFASELGIQGLLALLIFLFLLAFHIHKHHKNLPQNEAFLLGSLLSGGLASALHSFVDYDWQITANFFTLFLLAGLSANMLNLKGRKIDKGIAILPLLLLLISLDLAISDYYLQTAKRVLHKDPWRAKECLKLSSRFLPIKGEAKWYLGILTLKDNPKEALKLLKTAVRLHPYPPNFYQLGKIYLSMGDKREGERWLRRTLEVDPHSLPALLALGKLFLSEKKEGEARAIFQRILKIEKSPYELSKPIAFFKEPAYPIAKLELAKMMRNNPKEAKRLLEEAKKQCEEYLATYRQWREVMERFTYVDEREMEKVLKEILELRKKL
ncbi:O-antigen ligase family protein [bacterium]|nr:O-antigen ligase family protein [bacterium]